MSARELPAAVEAERAVLGAVLLAEHAWNEASSLRSDDFLLPPHRATWDAIAALAAQGVPADVLLVWDRIKAAGDAGVFEGGLAYFAGLPGLSANVAHYVERVRDAAARRRLIVALADVTLRAYDADVETPTVLAEARAALDKAHEGAATVARYSDLGDAVMTAIGERAKGQAVTGARTGIDALDVATGGLQPGWLVIIAAETGGGKTALAMQTAIDVCLRGGTALACNLEMTREELAERALIHVGQVNSQSVRLGQLGEASGEVWQRIYRADKTLTPAHLYLDDAATTMPLIQSHARRWRARHADVPGVLVVDFVQLIRSMREKGQTRAQEVGLFAQDLKALAKELRVPVILVSQLNRAGVKAGRPSKSDLKESGDLENAADLILLPYRQDPNSEEAEIIVDKFRHGQTGNFWAKWIGRHFRFANHERGHYAD